MVSCSGRSAGGIRLILTLLTSVVLLGSREASGAQLTASWVDNSGGVATTRIERRLGTDTVYAAVADAGPGVTAYVDTSVSQATTYCYRAFAYDADGVSPYTDETCATSAYDGVTVTVSKVGNGTGTVTSSPAGINCGTACSASYLSGTLVTLTATPGLGTTFDGWIGGCVGTAPCTLAGNSSVAVTASFSAATTTTSVASYTLTVAKSGPGTVASAPSGITCRSDCSQVYPSGTVVTLTAMPNNNGSTFAGWSGGGCSGSSRTCTFSLNAATSVSAAFKNGNGKRK